MKTKIFLIRHAQAEGNLFRLAHGQYDSTITPKGYQQLRYLRERFREIHLDAVYGSDLFRAHTTASALYLPKGLQFRPLPLLREVDIGCWEQMSWGEIVRQEQQMYTYFNKRPDLWRAQGAETFTAVRDRMLAAIRQIAAENPGKTVAATSHGAAMRTLLGTLEGLSLAEIGNTSHADNTAVSLLEVEEGQFRIVYRDDNSHLPPEVSTFRQQTWHKNDAATEPGLWFRSTHEDETGKAVDGMLEEDIAGRVAFRLEPEALRITEFEIIPTLRGRRFGAQLLGQAVQYARKHQQGDLILACSQELAGYFEQYGFSEVRHEGDVVELKMDIRLIMREIP